MTKRPEEMAAFFNDRATIYDQQQLINADGGIEGYQRLADFIPTTTNQILDLGCGTGLELAAIFAKLPTVKVTGIDLATNMLAQLRKKYADRNIQLINADYLQADWGPTNFDVVITVMSLHHFTTTEKLTIYERVFQKLPVGGRFINCDYMIGNNDQTQADSFAEAQQQALTAYHLDDQHRYHLDTPLTVKTEQHLLRQAGFAAVQQVWSNHNNVMLLAEK